VYLVVKRGTQVYKRGTIEKQGVLYGERGTQEFKKYIQLSKEVLKPVIEALKHERGVFKSIRVARIHKRYLTLERGTQ
jgi:hypothetical protein